MPAVPSYAHTFAKWIMDATVLRTMRSTVGATLAFVLAGWITGSRAPLLAPLTALVVIQVSLFATLTSGMRRVVAVVTGVLVSAGFSALVGLHWWSLGVLVLASLTLGRLLHVNEFVNEVAISAMLVLGVSHVRVAPTAWGRVAETLIGAATGALLNLLIAPPVLVQPAGEAIRNLAARMCALLSRIGEGLGGDAGPARTEDWLHAARELDQEIVLVDNALRKAEESMRLNPRVREGVLDRLVLRSGLDTMELCAVVLRALCRSLSDLAQERGEVQVYAGELGGQLNEIFRHLSTAVESFGQLITEQVAHDAEQAESELAAALEAGRQGRRRVADLLARESEREPRRWELHGALLATIDQLLSELDVDKRSQWLADELDRNAQQEPARRAVLLRFRRWSRRVATRAWERVRGRGGS